MINLKVGVVAIKKDKILLIKEKIRKNPVPLWNIIKGTYEFDRNESILESAKRECREEAGIDVDITHALPLYFSRNKRDITIQYNFLGKIKKGGWSLPSLQDQKQRGESISEIKWFSREEIKKMREENFISKIIYSILSDFIEKEIYSLNIYKSLDKR